MKPFLPLLLLLLLTFGSRAQTIPYSESFETDGAGASNGNRYTVYFPATPASNQYFERANNTTVRGFTNSVSSPTGSNNGAYFWACENVRGSSLASDAGNVTLQGITIGSYSNLEVTLALADPRYSIGNRSTARSADSVKVQYSYNNVNFRTVGYFSGLSSSQGSNWRKGGASNPNSADDLTTEFKDFTFSIGTPPTGATTLYVRVEAKYGGFSKEIAFDNIRVTGTLQTVPPPVLGGTGGTVAYAEGAAPVTVASGLTATNPSNTTLSGATVQLQAGANILSTADVLSFTPLSGSGISGSYDNTTRKLTFTGSSSTANYQTILRSVTYTNSDIYNARPGTRQAEFTVVDGARTSASVSQNITVTASLSPPAALPYTESFEGTANAEGTLYGSNSYNQLSQAFMQTPQNPIPGVGTVTFTNIEQSGYWYAEGTKTNTTAGKGVLQLRPVNATGFRDLHFTWRLGRGGNNYQTSDFVRLYYDRNDGAGPQLFGAFYGDNTNLRRDTNLDGTADADSPAITTALQDIDFTLPTALDNRADIDFIVEVANDGGKELAFDYIRITGTSNHPPVINAQTFSLAENSANGTVVGTVAASDPDAGQTLTYALPVNPGGAFALNSSTGQLTVANMAALDFETTPTFALTVRVSDGGLATTATITVNLTDLPNAAYLSSTTEQNTRGVLASSTNQVILRIPVVLNGNTDQPLSATSFTFSTAGTTAPADVAAARLYYTGPSGSFAATAQFGSVTAPGTGAIVLSGSQVLQPNTNYFWLVYDVAATAVTGNLLDGTLSALTIGGVSRPPTVTAPAGARSVIAPSDVAGTALRFTGAAASYVDLGTGNPNLVLGQQYTMEVWVKPAAGSSTLLNGLLGYDPGPAGQRSPYIAISENNQVEAGYGNGSSTTTASTATNATTTGQWNQVVVTFSGNTLSVYVNGTLLSQTIGGGLPVNTAVRYVGTLTSAATTFFKGDVEEVALWTRALTGSEIRLRRHLLLSGGEDGLTSYLQFNEASGNVQDLISGASGPLTGLGVSRTGSTAPVGTGVSLLRTVSGSANVMFPGTDVTINFTGSGNYTVTVARLDGQPQGTPPSGLARYYNQAYWVINKYDAGTFSNAAVTYALTPAATAISAGDAASPATTLRLLKRDSKSDGAFETPIAATAANQAAGTVTFNVMSFSQTVVGTLGTSPLPVELTRFTAERQGEAGLLRWATASEKNSAYFAVESSLTGRDFREVGRVPGQGSSAQAHDYQFVDARLSRYGAPAVYYRLRQVDQDGTLVYSPVRVLALPTVTGPTQLLAYPNPAHDEVRVLLAGAAAPATLELFDTVGRLVRSQPAATGGLETALPLTGLPAGLYLLHCGASSQRITVE